MKILHSADWHLEGKGRFQGKEEGTIKCLEWMLEKASLLSPSVILISGDIFEKSKVWIERGVKEISVAYDLIAKLSHIAPVVAIKGTPNHDGKEQFELLGEMLKSNKQVKIITQPEVYNLETKDGKVNIIGIPGLNYGAYRAINSGLSKTEENQALTDDLMEIIKTLRLTCEKGQKTILMAHYTTTGCNTEGGQVMMFSECEVVLPRNQLQELEFDLIALGHIHRPQEVATGIFYSGGINSFSFGDEGQDRGFYLHDLDTQTSEFMTTPYQKYQTIRFDNDDIEKFNSGDYTPIKEDLKGKVVRVYFEATQENINQFNSAALEAVLLQDALWVSEISCEKCLELNRTTVMGTDPIFNIEEYFKDDEDLPDIMEIARPVIEEKTITMNKSKGRMVPISIEVRDYRNYKAESFDYSDIHFATVFGDNGAGKSSFFMDTIIDCLYEETREHDLKGWISNRPGVKSGSIAFCFSIGTAIFRVVRTRTKAGKCTLSLCENIDNEWVDQSGEKIKETQESIINLVGDSLTLKSCGLIMQDQYGIFLEVDRTERMKVICGLLGLDLYEQAKNVFAENATETKRELNYQNKIKDDIIAAIRNGKGVEAELAICKKQLQEKESQQTDLEKEIKGLEGKQQLQNQLIEAEAKKYKIDKELHALNEIINQLVPEINTLKKQLDQEPEIRKNADEARSLEQQINGFAALEKQQKDQQTLRVKLNDLKTDIMNEIKNLNAQVITVKKLLAQKDELQNKSDAYVAGRKQLEKMIKLGEAHTLLLKEQQKLKEAYSIKNMEFENEYNNRIASYKRAKENHNLVATSGCKGSMPCPFIDKAKKEGANLSAMLEDNKAWKAKMLEEISAMGKQLDQKDNAIIELGYNPSTMATLNQTIEQNQKAHQTLSQLSVYEEKVIDLEGRITKEQEKSLVSDRELADNDKVLNNLTKQLEKRAELVKKFNQLKPYFQREQAIDGNKQVYALKTAALNEKTAKKSELIKQLDCSVITVNELTLQLAAFCTTRSLEEIQVTLDRLKKEIKDLSYQEVKLTVMREDRLKKMDELKQLQLTIKSLSKQLTLINRLKDACSYTGIPHLIVKDEIKIIENKANAILSQMSKGTMSVKFETEKITKTNGGKEVPVLDVFINEQGTGTLSYLSRSGGERVKVSLASALALAELKATKTGIQLGFMFLDEPPFLDDSGMEAYCDALQTINQRYAGMKVIAITHDVSMQSRFMQSIEIVKTEEGSRIIR